MKSIVRISHCFHPSLNGMLSEPAMANLGGLAPRCLWLWTFSVLTHLGFSAGNCGWCAMDSQIGWVPFPSNMAHQACTFGRPNANPVNHGHTLSNAALSTR